jgi:hypothetical protein
MIVLLIGLLPVVAFAAEDNTVRWVSPTTYENGEALPPEDIAKFLINVTWQGEPQAVLEAPGNTNAYVHHVSSRGLWCYTMQTVSVDNQVSDVSNQACKTVTHGKPRPPTSVTVE